MSEKNEAKELIFDVMQFYLECAQSFLSYDELMDLKIKLKNACRVFGIEQ